MTTAASAASSSALCARRTSASCSPPQVAGLNNLTTDPCQQALPVANAALTALCVATGVPAGLIGTVIPPISGQVNQTIGGDPLLDVEKATTFTAGIVGTPAFLPNITFSFDYFIIHIEDAISQPAVGDVVNGCYATARNPTLTFNAFCGSSDAIRAPAR